MRHEHAYVHIHIYRCIHISISYCPLLAAYLLMHSQDPATFQKPQPAISSSGKKPKATKIANVEAAPGTAAQNGNFTY